MLQYFNQHQFKIHQQNRIYQSEPTITIFLDQLLQEILHPLHNVICMKTENENAALQFHEKDKLNP